MAKVTKDGMTMAVRDNNQLAAFLNNGWKEITEEKPVEKQEEVSEKKSEEKDDFAEDIPEAGQVSEAEPPKKRGRKPAQK